MPLVPSSGAQLKGPGVFDSPFLDHARQPPGGFNIPMEAGYMLHRIQDFVRSTGFFRDKEGSPRPAYHDGIFGCSLQQMQVAVQARIP
jgi:hypothetical protein